MRKTQSERERTTHNAKCVQRSFYRIGETTTTTTTTMFSYTISPRGHFCPTNIASAPTGSNISLSSRPAMNKLFPTLNIWADSSFFFFFDFVFFCIFFFFFPRTPLTKVERKASHPEGASRKIAACRVAHIYWKDIWLLKIAPSLLSFLVSIERDKYINLSIDTQIIILYITVIFNFIKKTSIFNG